MIYVGTNEFKTNVDLTMGLQAMCNKFNVIDFNVVFNAVSDTYILFYRYKEKENSLKG
jgi:hypothetical protein